MSIFRSILRVLKNGEETNDKHKNPLLRTRYYKVSRRTLLEAVEHMIPKRLPGWKLLHVDRDRAEIMVEKKSWVGLNDIVITVYHVSPSESAIDIVSSNRGSFGDFGTSYNNILLFFNTLADELK